MVILLHLSRHSTMSTRTYLSALAEVVHYCLSLMGCATTWWIVEQTRRLHLDYSLWYIHASSIQRWQICCVRWCRTINNAPLGKKMNNTFGHLSEPWDARIAAIAMVRSQLVFSKLKAANLGEHRSQHSLYYPILHFEYSWCLVGCLLSTIYFYILIRVMPFISAAMSAHRRHEESSFFALPQQCFWLISSVLTLESNESTNCCWIVVRSFSTPGK